MRTLLAWAVVGLVVWAVLEGLARAWDHEYDAASYSRRR